MDDTHTGKPATSPSPIAWMNERVLPASEATVPLLDDGFLRGDAIFEGIMVRGGRTHALEAHLARMRRSAKALGLRLPVMRGVVKDLLAAWGDHDGSMRLVVTRGGTVRGLVQVMTWPESFALVPLEIPWNTPISGVKTLSYALNMWATRQAVAEHGDDALIVSDGVVHELPTAAVGWIRDGVVHLPDPATLPILDSVSLHELAKVTDVKLGRYPLEDVLAADEVFVLSASRPVMPVHAVGDQEFTSPGELTTKLNEAFVAHVDATLDPLP